MAYVMNDVGGWGTGALGDVSNPSGQINSYANVTAISGATVTIGTPSAGAYETFAVGKEIMLHVSAVLSGTDATKLGKYMVATITAVNGSVLTLSKDVPSNFIASSDLTALSVQAITIAQFNSLTLSSGQVSPPAYSVTNKCGGILLFKCKTAWNMSGSGAIYLVDKGIPTANASLRPLTTQETEMKTTGKTTGWENHVTARQLLLNAGDGAIGFWVKSLNVTGTANRIGSTAAGAQYYPYAVGDNSPSEVLGGSTILAVAETITGWTPTIISKGKGTGAGYGRCYIATETLLPNDEGLYAQDCISNPGRLATMGINDFGNGSLGNVTNPAGQLNSYAAITSISGKQITIGASNIGAYGGFDVGSQIIVHVSARKNTSSDATKLGEFYRTKILGVSGSVLTVSDDISFSTEDYYLQVVTAPQFVNITLSSSYSLTAAWDNTNKFGGICVIQGTGTFDISNGSILLGGKGLPADAQRPFIPTQCSGQQKDSLPISQGSGALLLMFPQIKQDKNSRIGWTTSGANYGGIGNAGDVGGGGFTGLRATANSLNGYGGFIGNTENTETGQGSSAGGSVFVVCDKWINFSLDILSVGGSSLESGNGGAGYGGGSGHASGGACGSNGGYAAGACGAANIDEYQMRWGGKLGCNGFASGSNGTNGGGPGSCYLYVGEFINPDWTGVAA